MNRRQFLKRSSLACGAGKLPEIGAGMGKAIKNFKGATSEIEHK